MKKIIFKPPSYKTRLNILRLIQSIAIILFTLCAILWVGGSDLQETWDGFVIQFIDGIVWCIRFAVIAGLSQVCITYEINRHEKKEDAWVREYLEQIEKAQKSCNSYRAHK